MLYDKVITEVDGLSYLLLQELSQVLQRHLKQTFWTCVDKGTLKLNTSSDVKVLFM